MFPKSKLHRKAESTSKTILGGLDDETPFTLTLHFLNADDVLQFGDLPLFEASEFEHFTYVIERSIRRASMGKLSTMEEAVTEMKRFPLQEATLFQPFGGMIEHRCPETV